MAGSHILVEGALYLLPALLLAVVLFAGRRAPLNPLGRGSDLFGTSNFLINYNLISFAAIWYVQIAAIVAGHVSGLILSHEQGLIEFKSPEAAIRSQYWMLAIMVGFTFLALWILSAVTTTMG